MKTLLRNIQLALAGESAQAVALRAIIGSKLYFDEAPMGTACPYCVLTPVSRVARDTLTGQIDWRRVQVSCLSAQSSSEQCWDLVSAVEAFFTGLKFGTVGFARLGGRDPFRGNEHFWRADPEFGVWLMNE